ncbi:MAG: potassium channel family protein [Candidatus Brocadiae bacterium]|nr:potassium channel family protein [Candidatus Brocadiia bacterium]
MENQNEQTFQSVSNEQVAKWIEAGKPIQGIQTENLSFVKQIFLQPIQFSNCQLKAWEIRQCIFKAPLVFSEVTFLGKVDWNTEDNGTIFEKSVSFKNCVFLDEFQAKGVEFLEEAFWEKCRFEKRASFPCVRFRGKMSFEGSQFLDTSRFEDIMFHNTAFFQETRFVGKANFKKSRFFENAFFRKTIFEDGATFENASINTARFEDMYSKNKIIFKVVSFQGKSYFHRSRFDEEFIFRGCDVQDHIYLSHLDCKAKADFSGLEVFNSFVMEESSFQDMADFSKSIFHHDVYLRGTVFHKEVNFSEAIFSMRFDLKDVKIQEKIKLEDTRTECMIIEKAQIEGKIFSDSSKEYANAKKVYAMLRRNFEITGNHDAADWAYYHFRCSERKSEKVTGIDSAMRRFFSWLFFDLGSGYGTKPSNVAILALLVILSFSLIFWAFGDQFVIDSALRTPGMQGISFSQAFYLSAMTFTTLGTEGISPQFDNWIKYFVVWEGFLGLFLMTVFVGVYTRKMAK